MPSFEAGEKYGCTIDRRCNLLKHSLDNKGKFTPETMMKLFDTTIPEGGPTFPDTGAIRTLYQLFYFIVCDAATGLLISPGRRISAISASALSGADFAFSGSRVNIIMIEVFVPG